MCRDPELMLLSPSLCLPAFQAAGPGSRVWWGEGATGVLWNPNRTDSQSSCLGKLCKQRGPPILGMFPGKALSICNQNSW